MNTLRAEWRVVETPSGVGRLYIDVFIGDELLRSVLFASSLSLTRDDAEAFVRGEFDREELWRRMDVTLEQSVAAMERSGIRVKRENITS